jgi:O-antigen/teichoic acid export membrane protein
MIILSWTIIPLSINYVMGTMMVAVQKEKEVVAVLMGNVIINIILNIFLIPRLSLYGAAMTTVLTEVFYLSGYYFLISREVASWTGLRCSSNPRSQQL